MNPGTPFPWSTLSQRNSILLDENNRLVTEPGQNGELCVAGTGSGLGYYRIQNELPMAFVQNPLNPCYPEIIYRTGDLACYGRDGLLYFNGGRISRSNTWDTGSSLARLRLPLKPWRCGQGGMPVPKKK